MMQRALLLLFLLCPLPVVLFAQPKKGQARLDSLLAELPKMKEDTALVKLVDEISHMYCYISPDEGLKWAEKELDLAQKLDWKAGEILAYNDLGNNYDTKGVYPSALDAFFKCLRLAEKAENKDRIGTVSGNIGGVYWRQKEYPKALKWYSKSLKTAEERGNKDHIRVALGNIGGIYAEMGQDREALEYELKALRLAEALNKTRGIIVQTGNIGGTYAHLKQYPLAQAYNFKALRIAEEAGDRQSAALNLGNIGQTYHLIAKDSADPKPDSLVPASRAAALAKGVKYLQKSIVACREAQFYEGISEMSKDLSDALSLQGDYKGALAAYKVSVAVQDSLHNTANNEKITNLETKRALELKDKDLQIAQLSHNKRRNERAFFIAGLLGLALVAGSFIRQSTLRKRANNQLAISNKQLDEANRIKARFFGILSHDLRAPIANLATYLHLQREAPEIMDERSKATHQQTIETAANNLLSVMEDLLLWSKGQMTSFKPEIKSIGVLALFHEIKKLLPAGLSADVVFNDPGLLHIDTDENFLKTIMRNLTANALKAIGNQPGGKVEWKAWEEEGKKYLSITDNGPGLNSEQVENLFAESAVTSSKTGLGLHIVRDFAQMLGQKLKVVSAPGEGTSFILVS